MFCFIGKLVKHSDIHLLANVFEILLIQCYVYIKDYEINAKIL